MPRSSDEPEVPRRRAVRKRATRRSTRESTAEPVRKQQDEVEQKPVKVKKPAPPPETTEERKAPTSLAGNKAIVRRKRKRLMVVGVLLVVGLGSSAAVGFTDQGQIDVQATIKARNDRIKNNQATEQDLMITQIEVPVQNTNKERKVDGGLHGLGIQTPPKPPVEVASTTASSTTASNTDATASSTAAVASSTEAVSEEIDTDAEAARPEDAPLETTPSSEATP
ncbi:hypothetical protein H6778_01005 [Candidatus Nomurabacteria bacterium]|nr:hypothetical protein [Candidatus Nomurabacteria bacterium]